jgi:RNA polymerase sigma-70 factor (ECF subfamily)
MSEPSQPFAALLARARQGDATALAQLTQQYEAKIRLVARVLLGPALRPYLDSMDLVQSVHYTVMLGLRAAQFDLAGPENLLALAVTLVRRKVARQWRRLQRQQRLSSGGAPKGDLALLLTSLSAPEDDPARAAQFKDQVEQLCSHLNETERRILEARLQGYSTAEIAQQVGLHAIALRVRLTRLRQRLEASGVLTDWL